mmetsp:Transcript_96783/g.153205  ORF Transcript_96783/g.153205 Transcript_96783/m.153205 type:complete len:620 (+) Transcript_96783:70-1929(+)
MVFASTFVLVVTAFVSSSLVSTAALPPSDISLHGKSEGSPPIASATGSSSSNGVKLVRLRFRDARPVDQRSQGKSFYTTRIFVGKSQSQALRVNLDTASGQVVLPDFECPTQACLEHRRYWHHQSGVEVNADGSETDQESKTSDAMTIGFSSLDLGDGSITGILVNDSLCLALGFRETPDSKDCTNISMVAATSLSDVPFRAAPYDGTIGLGLRGLSLRAGFNFLFSLGLHGNMDTNDADIRSAREAEQGLLPRFALYYGQHFGEAAFGGHNPTRLSSPLVWVPVLKPEDGFWQMQIASIRIGNRTLNACSRGTCRAIIDSGTSSIGIHASMLPEFASAFPVSAFLSRTVCSGPDMHIGLQGNLQLTLKAQDYTQSVRSSPCKPRFSSLDGLPDSFEGVLVIGEPLLRRYYTVFDWTPGDEKIAFGLAAPVEDNELEAVRRAEAAEDLQEASEVPLDDVVLSQFDVVFALFQNFVARVLILICFIAFGTNHAVVRAFASVLEGVVSRRKLLEEVSAFTTAISGDHIPDGDECVICLGSCDDDPEVNAGIPGLQALSQCGAKEHLGMKHPRWLRLRCGHHFHATCIFEWLQKTKQCPVCRRHLKDKNPGQWGASVDDRSA